jgi:hypothetical protein
MTLRVPCLGWVRPRGRSRPTPTSLARTAGSSRRPRHRLPRRNAAPTQSIWLPSRRHDERWRGRRRTRFRPPGGERPAQGRRSPCLLLLRRVSGCRIGPGRAACGRSERRWPNSPGASRVGRGPRSHRSGGDQQSRQPFKLTDFAAESAYARAICRLQAHGCGEVAMPCRSVPALAVGGCARLWARVSCCR